MRYHLVANLGDPTGEGIHLGTAEPGQPFMFRGHPDLGVTDYRTWLSLVRSGHVVTEQGAEVDLNDFLTMVERTQPDSSVSEVDDRHRRFTNFG